jgi:hypothetical protein
MFCATVNGMNKKTLAVALLELTNEMNGKLADAFKAGLRVHLTDDNTWPTEEASKNSRPLKFLKLKVENGEVLAENVNPKYVKTPWYICEHNFGEVITWAAGTDPLKADVYEECSKCGTKRFYIYPKTES